MGRNQGPLGRCRELLGRGRDYSDALGDDSDSFARDSDAFDGGPDGFERGDDDSEFYRPSAADHFFADRRESEELELEYDEEEEDDEGSWVERRGPTAQWLLETPPEDRIGPSHYRRILSATCTDLEPLGRSRVVRIHFEGESFMLHQVGADVLADVFGDVLADFQCGIRTYQDIGLLMI